MPATSFALDIVSDTICPWCYVGKRRLEAALPVLAAEGLAFATSWRPFQLNPDMPAQGVERRTYRTAKFGSWQKSEALDAQVGEAFAAEGLAFRADLMLTTPNTLASLALIRLADEIGGAALQDRVVEALFAAYFSQGSDVGDQAVLTWIAVDAGIDRDRVAVALADPVSLAEVAAEEARARGQGLSGVPSFFLDGHFLFSGAHPTPFMVQSLRTACSILAERRRAPVTAA